jgi:hypothetical protein
MIAGKQDGYIEVIAEAADVRIITLTTMGRGNKGQQGEKWVKTQFIPRLRAAFPDERVVITIRELEIYLLYVNRQKEINVAAEEIAVGLREATGFLMRGIREAAQCNILDAQALFRTPVLKDKLPAMEAGSKFPGSIYRSGMMETCNNFSSEKRGRAPLYCAWLKQMECHFKMG